MPLETDTRILINRILCEAGWDKGDVFTEETAADRHVDYMLKDTRSYPLAIIEAKRLSVDSYSAKDHALADAQALPMRFFILSDGQDHYFSDYADGMLDRAFRREL